MVRVERGGMERVERGGMERVERGGMERVERGGDDISEGFTLCTRGGDDVERGLVLLLPFNVFTLKPSFLTFETICLSICNLSGACRP